MPEEKTPEHLMVKFAERQVDFVSPEIGDTKACHTGEMYVTFLATGTSDQKQHLAQKFQEWVQAYSRYIRWMCPEGACAGSIDEPKRLSLFWRRQPEYRKYDDGRVLELSARLCITELLTASKKKVDKKKKTKKKGAK